MDNISFFQDLSVVLIIVGVASFIFTKFGWPKVIGYIFAGVLAGKYTYGGSMLVSPENVNALGQIGLVFLMFTLGLEFSASKLKKVRHVIFPTAAFDMVVMMWLGYVIGTQLLGWGSVQSLFLGAAISDSATTLLAKTIGDMGWSKRHFTRYIFGITIVEDIFCIGLLALLTGLAQSGTMDLFAVGRSMGGLTLFMTGVSVLGIVLVPRILNTVAKQRDDETLLLTILGFCFLVSYIADKLNFSLALGAFLVGIMGAGSRVRERIHTLCIPLRTLFSAIFFVTIGMLIDPMTCLHNAHIIWLLSAVVIIGKTLNCTFASILTGQDVKNAIQTGFGLAQIGEFAYMVALIGITSGAVDSSLYQVTVGVSLVTTMLNPVMLRASDPIGNWVQSNLPLRVRNAISGYGEWIERFRNANADNKTRTLLRRHTGMILLQWVLIAFYFMTAILAVRLDYTRWSPFLDAHKNTIFCFIASLMSIANAFILARHARRLAKAITEAILPHHAITLRWGNAFRHLTIFVTLSVTLTLTLIEISMLNVNIVPEDNWARWTMIALLALIALIGWERFKTIGETAYNTLSEAIDDDAQNDPLDVHNEEITLAPLSSACGETLISLNLRATLGVSVISIEREGITYSNPRATERLISGDILTVLGSATQINKARALFESERLNAES